ncbi:5-hydroxytryptamine receptor 2A-like [Dendronephthya gigantea]|uniref:5-hydroxytryptamine receptor 2A-like n=1 Tax=Dendronephthya gigantea TaxID=151771 RepID=UPI00106C5E88|nr:5-hydroxytryptamine receptor 2A-like [Dendronephthya gigantea]
MPKNSSLNGNATEESIEIPDVNVPFGLTVELIIFIILSENVLIFLTVHQYKKIKVIDLLILSLATSDFANALLPLQMLNIKAHFIISPWSRGLCGTFVWSTYALRFASLSTVSLMSIEKAVLLFQPLRYYTQMTLSLTRKLILGAWVSSALIATPAVAFHFKNSQTEKKDVNCRYQPYQFGLEFGVAVETIGMLHFFIVLGSYLAMVLSSKGFRQRQKRMLSSAHGGRKENKKGRTETRGMLQSKQLCRVMGYVVLLYYVTWLPFLIYNLYGLVSKSTAYNRKMGAIVGMSSLIAPVLNPVLYVRMLSRYRKGFLILFGRRTDLGSEDAMRCSKSTQTIGGRPRTLTSVTFCGKGEVKKQHDMQSIH